MPLVWLLIMKQNSQSVWKSLLNLYPQTFAITNSVMGASRRLRKIQTNNILNALVAEAMQQNGSMIQSWTK